MTLLADVWDGVVRVPENRSAMRAVRRLAQCLNRRIPPTIPLVLHGPTGVGKSAIVSCLIQAVTSDANALSAQVVSAHDIDPRPGEDEERFQEWECCDLLLVEDVQHLPERSADWLRRLLDERTSHRRATVLTANVGPAALGQFPRGLTSRIVAGLVVPMDALSPASRRVILAQAAERRGIHLTESALDDLAQHPTGGGMRPLLGVLDALKASHAGRATPIEREDVEYLLGEGQRKPGFFDVVVLKVAAAFDVKPRDLRGTSRLRTVLLARHVAIYLAHEIGKESLPVIGRAFGRDHTTVLHAVRKVRELVNRDPNLAGMVEQLTRELS